MEVLALRKDLEKSRFGLVKFACIKIQCFLTTSNGREKTKNNSKNTTLFFVVCLFWGRKGRNTKYLK